MNVLIIGGNKFFGKRVAANFLAIGAKVTLLNRGNVADSFGSTVSRILSDRNDSENILRQDSNSFWDIIIDQISLSPADAKSLIKIFGHRANHFVVISSQAVYGFGKYLTEDDFEPRFYEIPSDPLSYADSKRACEKILAESGLPVTFIRLPVVLGADDYTGRLEFHIDRIAKKLPIYLPSPNAICSFISSSDAADGICHMALKKIIGPVNITPEDSLSLKEFLTIIHSRVGGEIELTDIESKETKSPYGFAGDIVMSPSRSKSLGFEAASFDNWLSKLIDEVSSDLRNGSNALKLGKHESK